MIKGPEPLTRSSSTLFKDWEELSKQILRKCVKKIEERPVLIIEMLFSKSASTAHFLEYGYEKQTVSTTNPRPAAELEFRLAVERDRQIAIVVGVLLDKNQHQHLLWVKRQLEAAGAEKRAWKALDTAMDTLEVAGPDSAEREAGTPPAEPSAGLSEESSPITIRPEDEACRKAMFKNAHLRLLMKLVGFERLVSSIEETIDSVWVVPGSVTAEQLRESLEFINKAEFEPPVFDNDQSAEDQLKRKTAPRKKAVYDDDDDNGNDGLGSGDDMLFPAGGPTARKIVDEGRKKKTLRRRRKRGDDDDGGEGEVGPTEEELDERAQRRRQKELEKARRIKSDLYVHASDDETDDEKDREFFEREEAIRQRVHKAVLLSRDSGEGRVGAGEATKTKRKLAVLSDEEDEEEGDSQELSPRRRKRRKSVETDDGDGSDEDVTEPTATSRKKTSSRQHAGFVDSSSDEDENMETDETPITLTTDRVSDKEPSETSDKESEKQQPDKVPEDAGKDGDDDDDDDDVVPTANKKRQRARGGFLADSDDDE
ncbi:DNA repair protein [Grosmannia clavigera kw1407]|uniref:DNA repair protein n=1 Tax=Grosmannia clavigera (strain kw1407 / UAMH 11150) TaxID=655863 RepID=F0XEA3_GROCL|nr:DNA repair protein [Grosmannia clavigera kw1407]EFX04011.1 DNA repair protein [Grosmannia clavigera kw1407]